MEGIIPPLYLALARPHLDTAYGLRPPTARETSTNRSKPREVLVMVGGRHVCGGWVHVARMQKQGLLSCRQGGTRLPRASPLSQESPGDIVARPCSQEYSESTGGTSTSCSTRHSPKETALPMQAGRFCPWRQP